MPTPISENTTIREIFEYGLNQGLKFFKIIIESYTPNWDYDPDYTDIEYGLMHSGDKAISHMLYYFLTSSNLFNIHNIEDIDQVIYNDMVKILMNKFNNKWTRLYDVLVAADYAPLENYNMIEERTVTGTATTTTTQEINQKTTEKIDETRQIDNSNFGFNVATGSPVSSGTETNSTGLNGNTVEVQTQGDGNVTTTTSELEPYKLTRSGNIGVTTSQQMATSELELRKNDFLNIVYADIDSILCSKIYN